MKHLLSLLALAFSSFVALTANAATPSLIQHSSINGNTYVAYYDEKTPAASQTFCLTKGGHLAVANTHTEVSDLQKLIALNPGVYYWLGSSVQAGVSDRVTVTGQAYYLDTVLSSSNDIAPSNTVALYQSIFSGAAVNQGSDYFEWLASDTNFFICEFEDAPI